MDVDAGVAVQTSTSCLCIVPVVEAMQRHGLSIINWRGAILPTLSSLIFVGKMYESEKATYSGDRRSEEVLSSGKQNLKTIEKVAEQFKVCTDTAWKAEQFSDIEGNS